jgi:hypothetical protein
MMPPSSLDGYAAIWLIDYEYVALPGTRPNPACMVAHELRSRRTIKLWREQLRALKSPPYSIDRDSLFIAYAANAEMGCHLALNWPLPINVLDLFVEFRLLLNGLTPPAGFGLLGALAFFGLDTLNAVQKEVGRGLFMEERVWSAEERKTGLEYCEGDVFDMVQLLPRMLPKIDLVQSVACRGRHMRATARIEDAGIPFNAGGYRRLVEWWPIIKDNLVRAVDSEFHVFEGTTFKKHLWAEYVARTGKQWPRLASGALALGDNVFKAMAKKYPDVARMRELRTALAQLRNLDLPIGPDGRHRRSLRPFSTKTGRYAHSSSGYVFGPATWLRSLIRPSEGTALAYLDWSQQEFGVAAALSSDEAMMRAYTAGDPYLEFARQAGAIPPTGTKESHRHIRDIFKTCALGVMYGMSAGTLAMRIDRPLYQAEELLRLHRKTYQKYWRWSDAALDHALWKRELATVFGWRLHVGPNPNPRSLRNYLIQSTGGELLRLAINLVTERGAKVVASVHDSVMLEASADEIDETATAMQTAMAEATEIILGGLPLRSDAQIIKSPARFVDEKGEPFWRRVVTMIKTKRTRRNVDRQLSLVRRRD